MTSQVEFNMATRNVPSMVNSTFSEVTPDSHSVLGGESTLGSQSRVLLDLEQTAGSSAAELTQALSEHREILMANRRRFAIMTGFMMVSFLILLGTASLSAVTFLRMELTFREDGTCKISANLASNPLVLRTSAQTVGFVITTDTTAVTESTVSQDLLVFRDEEPNWF